MTQKVLTPLPVRLPGYLYHLAANAPIKEADTASKIRLLLNHFLDSDLPVPNMKTYVELGKDKPFTLRVVPETAHKLDEYCLTTSYNRQQVLQIAIVASLKDLTDLC